MKWTNWFSQEGDQDENTCASDYLVARIECKGYFCDSLRLHCAKTKPGYTIVSNKKHDTKYFSEEKKGFMYCPAGYYLHGIKCRDDYCGEISLRCVQVDWS